MVNREAWLERTIESVIDPDLPICDPHHHLWDYPGSRYLLEEFRAEFAGGHRVTDTVFVECRTMYRNDGPPTLQPVGETEFVERVVRAGGAGDGNAGVAAGIIGFADLTLGAAVRPVLEAHRQASTRFRGVRYASAWHASDSIHNAQTDPPADLLRNPQFRAGFACLRDLDLRFDAWVYHPQHAELADLAQAFPEVTIVVDHFGGPLRIGPYAGRRAEAFEEWRRNLTALSRCANVVMKLGGLTMKMSGFGWHAREVPPGSAELATVLAPYVATCIEQFGAERCMFESNFPIDRVSCSYTVLWNAFKRVTQDCSAAERQALFHGTAARVYRLGV